MIRRIDNMATNIFKVQAIAGSSPTGDPPINTGFTLDTSIV